jgi:tRNA nucleotidyltransferase (CCA-adding enzyme)
MIFMTNFLDPQNWPFGLELLPDDAYLVGGTVRDALLERQRDYLDLDFVLPSQAVETARKIARLYQGGFVVLDEVRQIARVVFEQGTADFAQQEGKSLLIDLQRRDYTLNAIAYNPHTQELIDPLDGLKDLKNRQIRMIAAKNLEDDPLRLLRAYRQASQLNLTIESNTRITIKQLAPLLSQVAAERVKSELDYLLENQVSCYWLQQAYEDQILSVWLQNINSENILKLNNITQEVQELKAIFSQLNFLDPSWYSLAKLALLVSSNLETVEFELMNLKYSRSEIKTVITALKYLPNLQDMSLREQYFFFLNMGDVFPTLALLGRVLGINQDIINSLMERYLDTQDPVAHPKILVNGNDLMKALNISPSPKIRELLTEITIAQIEGKIATVEEALAYAKMIINN